MMRMREEKQEKKKEQQVTTRQVSRGRLWAHSENIATRFLLAHDVFPWLTDWLQEHKSPPVFCFCEPKGKEWSRSRSRSRRLHRLMQAFVYETHIHRLLSLQATSHRISFPLPSYPPIIILLSSYWYIKHRHVQVRQQTWPARIGFEVQHSNAEREWGAGVSGIFGTSSGIFSASFFVRLCCFPFLWFLFPLPVWSGLVWSKNDCCCCHNLCFFVVLLALLIILLLVVLLLFLIFDPDCFCHTNTVYTAGCKRAVPTGPLLQIPEPNWNGLFWIAFHWCP